MLNDYLAKAIVTLRHEKRLSQTAAPGRAGVANSAWSLWESGNRVPQPSGIRQICQGLGCSRFELEMKINQLHTDDLTEKAARIGAAPPVQNTTELIKALRNFGIVLSTQYQPLIDAILELHLLVRQPDPGEGS